MNLHGLNPNQKGYRRRLTFIALGFAKKMAIKWGLFLTALTGITITFLVRFGLAIALFVLSITNDVMTGLFAAYEKLIAAILNTVI